MNRFLAYSLLLGSLACMSAPSRGPLAQAQISADFGRYSIQSLGLVVMPDDPLAGTLAGAVALEFSRASDYSIRRLNTRALGLGPSFRCSIDGNYPVEGLDQVGLSGVDGLLIPKAEGDEAGNRLRLQIDLVACETGQVVWSATTELNMAERATREALGAWQAARQPLGGVRSPSNPLVCFAVSTLADLL